MPVSCSVFVNPDLNPGTAATDVAKPTVVVRPYSVTNRGSLGLVLTTEFHTVPPRL